MRHYLTKKISKKPVIRHSLAAGFTLVEIMIAISITLFLSAGMAALVFSMNGSFKTQDKLSRIQETQLFTFAMLDNTIRTTGYFTELLTTRAVDAFPATLNANPDGTKFVAEQILSGTSGAGGASDTINIRVQAGSGDGIMNCLGDTNDSGAKVTWSNSFSINASNQLVCAVSTNGAIPEAAVALADKVSTMKILYGVDSTGIGSIDTYLSATDMSADLWSKVIATKITIIFIDQINSTTSSTISLPSITHNINLMSKSFSKSF